MDAEDQMRLLRKAASVEQGLAAVAGEDPGRIDATHVEGAALTVLTAIEEQYPNLREWIDQAEKFAAARTAAVLGEETEEVTDVVKDKLTSAMERERWELEHSRPPNANDPPRVLRAYVAIARVAAGGPGA